eukprot:Gb_30853 [translate_table: standard]
MENESLLHSQSQNLDCSASDASMQVGYVREEYKKCGRRVWDEGCPLEMMEEEEAITNKKKRAENWQDSEVDGLVTAYRQIHRKLALAGKKGKHVFRSAQEKWHEVYQILVSMGIDRQPKEIERKWSNLITGYKQIGDWNRRHGHKAYWEMDEHLKKEKTKFKELPATFRIEVYEALSEFLGDSCNSKPRVRVSEPTVHADAPSNLSPSTGEVIEVPLQLDKLSCHAPSMDVIEEKHWQVVLVSIGCFDPPTYLHLRMFELARDALISEGHHVLGGYMSPINDLQGKTVTPAEHRIKMCQLATTDSHFIMVDQWEAKQNFPQKATSVLSKLENALGTSDYYPEEKIRVMLLCGSDVLESFATAGTNADQIEALCDEHGIVCISRDGNSIRKCIYDHDFLYENKRNIIVVDDWISNGNTSSKVRWNLLLKLFHGCF